jgi:UDP-N-acetylmuramoyl-L-alanyl-D-glutamate--2,6-diaminopimelate ligase
MSRATDGAERQSPRVPLANVVARLEENGLLVQAADADVMVQGITDDSRRVEQGDLFCAWTGTASDSHSYVATVERAGAVAAIVEKKVEGVKLPQVVVRDGRRAAALAAALVFGDPQDDLTLVGVTGTNGKTTTVWILRHLLSELGRVPTDPAARAASLGTLGLRTGADQSAASGESLTTPGPVDLARTLRDLVDDGFRALAMEVSSHALDQGRVHSLRFDVVVFTNLTRDHLDYHQTMEAYRAAKLSLLELLRPSGTAVLNADEAAWSGISAARVLRFSVRDEHADILAENIQLSASGACFDLVTRDTRAPVQLPLLGGYNVENALGAAAACVALGYSVAQIAAGLATVSQVPGRLERIATTPCPVLADYAHTPDALERALATLRPLVKGRLIVVFGAGGDRDRGKRPLMGEVAERLSDVAIVTSDNPRTEHPDAIIDEIVAGMKRGTHVRVTDRRAAIAHALRIAEADDCVLLAGKGHEDYQVVGTTKHPFDERVVVRELLEMQGAGT